MKTAMLIATAAATAEALSTEAGNFLLSSHFDAFKAEHGKSYASEEEHAERLAIFEATVERVAARNAELTAAGNDAIHGITRFADLTEDEFAQQFLTLKVPEMPEDMQVNEAPANYTASGSFNWNDKGMLTAVKDQGYCGSCWAFSATETIESAWAIAGQSMQEFSPQQIVSCDSTDNACSGGLPTNAFDYVKGAGGLALESDYPYTSGAKGDDGTCQSFTPAGGQVDSWSYATPKCDNLIRDCTDQDEDTLQANLESTGPVSIAIDASKWSDYTGGVMTSDSCSSSPRSMDHAVQLVGYNADADVPYWIVRNSWASSWGEDGFIYLKMGDNTCGTANLAAQVKVAV